MGKIGNKSRNAAQGVKGKTKEAAGKSTGKTGEKIKNVFR